MSKDKLSVAAQAAGYAMAWDETADGSLQGRGRVEQAAKAGSPEHAQAKASDVVVSRVNRDAPNWNPGWSFWKTA